VRLLWLPEVLRAAGLTVREVDGWQSRGSDEWGPIVGITCHATAGTGTDAQEINVLLNGSTSAPPPIAQLFLNRAGVWHVVASGRCNHNLSGWAGPNEGHGNRSLIGVEAANDNVGEQWPPAQLDSYQRGVAALCRRLGVPAARVAAHHEHQPFPPPPGETSTKTDPRGINMGDFRARVAALVTGEDDDMPTADEIANAVMAELDAGNDTSVRGALHAAHAGAATAAARAEINGNKLNALTAKVDALAAAFAELASQGGSADTAAIIAAINAAADRAVT
jgi:hypothetical protein